MIQAAQGALIGELMMGRRLGNWALAWGAFFSILPNAEQLISLFLSTAMDLVWLGGISHSLGFMALGSYGMGHGLGWLWREKKISRVSAGSFVAMVWTSHLLLDCLTVKGAGILWPVVNKRVAMGILDSRDFIIAVPWVITVLWILSRRPVKAPKRKPRKVIKEPMPLRRRLCLYGLGVSAFYLLMVVGLKALAHKGFESDLARRGVKYTRLLDGPMPYNCLLWRGVVDHGDEFWVGYRSVFEGTGGPMRWTIYPKGAAALSGLKDGSDSLAPCKYSDDWWIARPNAKGAWIGDVRFPESRIWGQRKTMVDSRLLESWLISEQTGDEPLQAVLLAEPWNTDYLKRMMQRIFGDRERWEANPRLAGVEGSLPESLPVME
jgi:inner membrane protein